MRFLAAALLLLAVPALAQSPGIPNLSVVNNDDLIQVVPRGVPTSPSRFATPPVIFTNRTVTNPALVGGSFSGNWAGNLNLNNGLSVTGTSTLSGGGTLSGTFGGTPTASGAWTFSGGANITGGTQTGATYSNGTINNTPIGGTTPSTGAFTTLSGSVTATNSTTARTLAERFAGCDPGSTTTCNFIDAKDYGLKVGNTGAANRTALQAAATAACSATVARTIIKVPPGLYSVDLAAGEILFNGCLHGAGLVADGFGSVQFNVTNATGNNFLHFKAPTTSSYIDGVLVRGIRVFESDNPPGGAHVFLDHVQLSLIADSVLAGGYNVIHCTSCLDVVVDNIASPGLNNQATAVIALYDTNEVTLNTTGTTGSGTAVVPMSDTTGVYVGQTITGSASLPANASVLSYVPNTSVTLNGNTTGTIASGVALTFRDGNNAENVISNSDLRAQTQPSYSHSLVVTNSDGLQVSNSHFGFNTNEDVLLQTKYDDDQLSGFSCGNSSFDQNNSTSFRIAPSLSGSPTGFHGNHTFAGCVFFIANVDGLKIDDPLVNGVNVAASRVTSNGRHGINIQAGTNINLSGNFYALNNRLNLSGDNLLVGGTATNVNVAGSQFVSSTPNVVNHIAISDTADFVQIAGASNQFLGTTTQNIDSSGSTGTHNATTTVVSTATGWVLRTEKQADMFDSSTSCTSTTCQFWRLNSAASTGPTLIATDELAGANVNGTVQARGTGKLILGVTTNSQVGTVAPVTVGADASSVTPFVGTVSTVANAHFSAAGDQRAKSVYQLWVATSGSSAVRLTTDGSGTATTSNCGNLTVNNAKATLGSLRLTATDVTTPANDYAYFVPVGFLRRYTGVGSTTYTNGTPIENGTGTGTGAGAPTTAITADTTNACPNISWTPPTGNTDTWHVMVSFEMDIVQ